MTSLPTSALSGLPPGIARPDNVVYRSKKFLRRNWRPVAAVGAVILVLLIGVLLGASGGANRPLTSTRCAGSRTRRTGIHDEVATCPDLTSTANDVKTGLEYLETLAASSQGDLDLQRELGGGYRRIGDVQGSVLEANLGTAKERSQAIPKLSSCLRTLRGNSTLDVQNDILVIHGESVRSTAIRKAPRLRAHVCERPSSR